jgi:hypothetical protein
VQVTLSSVVSVRLKFIARAFRLCILKKRAGILRARSETRFHVTLIDGWERLWFAACVKFRRFAVEAIHLRNDFKLVRPSET